MKVAVDVTVGEGVRVGVVLGPGRVRVGEEVGLAVDATMELTAVAVTPSGGSVEVGLAEIVTTALGVGVG